MELEGNALCEVSARLLRQVTTTICFESWFLYSMVEDWLRYLLGLVAVFDMVFLYGLVFFFLFEMVVVVFCSGVLLMMGLGLRRAAF